MSTNDTNLTNYMQNVTPKLIVGSEGLSAEEIYNFVSSTSNSSSSGGSLTAPSSIQLFYENPIVKNTLAQVDYKAIQSMFEMFLQMYNSSLGKMDVFYRLGKPTEIKLDNSKTIFTNNAGSIYTRALFNEKYNILRKANTNKKMQEAYVNLYFPPYKYDGEVNAVSSMGSFDSNQTEDWQSKSYNSKNFTVNRNGFTFRELGFKTVNDLIEMFQWLFEGVSGIVSTYLTEWDLSMYIQEGILSFDTSLSQENELIHLNYRLKQDNPSGYLDDRAYTYAVLNGATSKFTCQKPWNIKDYPLSSFWLPRDQNPSTAINEINQAIPLNTANGYLSALNFLNEIKRWDTWNAKKACWTDWGMYLYKALYPTPDDGLTDADLEFFSPETTPDTLSVASTSANTGSHSESGLKKQSKKYGNGSSFVNSAENLVNGKDWLGTSESPASSETSLQIGLPKRNPVSFGGPHGNNMSPRSPYSLYDSNPVLRNTPRFSFSQKGNAASHLNNTIFNYDNYKPNKEKMMKIGDSIKDAYYQFVEVWRDKTRDYKLAEKIDKNNYLYGIELRDRNKLNQAKNDFSKWHHFVFWAKHNTNYKKYIESFREHNYTNSKHKDLGYTTYVKAYNMNMGSYHKNYYNNSNNTYNSWEESWFRPYSYNSSDVGSALYNLNNQRYNHYSRWYQQGYNYTKSTIVLQEKYKISQIERQKLYAKAYKALPNFEWVLEPIEAAKGTPSTWWSGLFFNIFKQSILNHKNNISIRNNAKNHFKMTHYRLRAKTGSSSTARLGSFSWNKYYNDTLILDYFKDASNLEWLDVFLTGKSSKGSREFLVKTRVRPRVFMRSLRVSHSHRCHRCHSHWYYLWGEYVECDMSSIETYGLNLDVEPWDNLNNDLLSDQNIPYTSTISKTTIYEYFTGCRLEGKGLFKSLPGFMSNQDLDKLDGDVPLKDLKIPLYKHSNPKTGAYAGAGGFIVYPLEYSREYSFEGYAPTEFKNMLMNFYFSKVFQSSFAKHNVFSFVQVRNLYVLLTNNLEMCNKALSLWDIMSADKIKQFSDKIISTQTTEVSKRESASVTHSSRNVYYGDSIELQNQSNLDLGKFSLESHISLLEYLISLIKPVATTPWKNCTGNMLINTISNLNIIEETLYASNMPRFIYNIWEFLNVLYETRSYFLGKRCNKMDGTYYALRHLEQLSLAAQQKLKVKPADTEIDSNKMSYRVVHSEVQNTAIDKAQAIITNTSLDPDRITKVYIAVEYPLESITTQEEADAYEKRKGWKPGDEPILIRTAETEDTTKFWALKPKNSSYQLRSKEWDKNELNKAKVEKEQAEGKTPSITTYDYDLCTRSIIWKDEAVYTPILRGSTTGVNTAAYTEYKTAVEDSNPLDALCMCQTTTDYWTVDLAKANVQPKAEGYLKELYIEEYSESQSQKTSLSDVYLTGRLFPVTEDQGVIATMIQDSMDMRANLEKAL